jgi:putative transposase
LRRNALALDKNGKQIKGTKIIREGYVTQGFEYACLPLEFQKQEMEQCFGCGRKLYNEYVAGLYEFLESIHYVGGKITYKIPSYTTITNKYEFMQPRLHDSKVYANVKLNFANALKKYNEDFAWKENQPYKKLAIRRAKHTDYSLSFRDLKGLPRFHSKKMGKFSCITNNYKDPTGKYVIYLDEKVNEKTKKVEHFIRLPKIGWLKIHLHRPLPEGSIINNVTLKREYDRYMVSINVDFPFRLPVKREINQNKIVGLDYSQGAFYVDNNGNSANPPKYYRENERKIKRLQRSYSRKYENEDKKPSKNKEKALKRLQKLSNKITLQRKHWLHTISRQIANEWDCVGLEDINLRNMSQTLNLAKNLQDNGFGLFRTYLKYKLERQGKIFMKVSWDFPSSKKCSNCHHVKTELKLSERTYKCLNCKKEMNRDQNAAENIKQEVIKWLSEQNVVQIISS